MRITLNIFLSLIILLSAAFTALCGIENQNFNKLLFRLPASSFDHTSEGISQDELGELIKRSKSSSWRFINQGDDIITVKCIYGDSSVTFYMLSPEYLLVYTRNESVTKVVFFKDNESHWLKEAELLPVILAEDFVKESEKHFKDISKYNSNVYFDFDAEERKIFAHLNTWMVPEFENREVDYKIHLEWDDANKRFKIVKSKQM